MIIKGIILKQSLQNAGLKQEDAAKKLGISRPTLSVWCNKDVLSDDIISQVRESLNIDLTNVSPVPADNTHAPTLNRDKTGVPYYDIDFMGGFDMVYDSQTVNPSYYIDFMPFNNADYWINVTGKSMGPLIAHGDIVALKKVDDWQSFLLMGDIYAIVTNNNLRTIKMLEEGKDDDHYLLVPYNDKHRKQNIPKNVITHVFKVIGCIKKFF